MPVGCEAWGERDVHTSDEFRQEPDLWVVTTKLTDSLVVEPVRGKGLEASSDHRHKIELSSPKARSVALDVVGGELVSLGPGEGRFFIEIVPC